MARKQVGIRDLLEFKATFRMFLRSSHRRSHVPSVAAYYAVKFKADVSASTEDRGGGSGSLRLGPGIQL